MSLIQFFLNQRSRLKADFQSYENLWIFRCYEIAELYESLCVHAAAFESYTIDLEFAENEEYSIKESPFEDALKSSIEYSNKNWPVIYSENGSIEWLEPLRIEWYEEDFLIDVYDKILSHDYTAPDNILEIISHIFAIFKFYIWEFS